MVDYLKFRKTFKELLEFPTNIEEIPKEYRKGSTHLRYKAAWYQGAFDRKTITKISVFWSDVIPYHKVGFWIFERCTPEYSGYIDGWRASEKFYGLEYKYKG